MTLPAGFVYLSDIDPSIKKSLRYCGDCNFLGTIVDGYINETVILTNKAAQLLTQIQQKIAHDGYGLVIYDSYRPQMAVDHFLRWSLDVKDQRTKSWFYPNIDKTRVFELGYMSKRSSHTRGSTVDLTLIKLGEELRDPVPQPRIMLDGSQIVFLDDGTVDMGSSFDLLDQASHYENNLIADKYKLRRNYLKQIMVDHGFKPYSKEWWHFSLENEPFPDIFFNFPVE